MTMTEWAEMEIAAACKRENPNWDGKSFDYGCACYQSALKAYKSLMADEHSGFSFDMTKNILIRLLNSIPLSPITDEDFFAVEDGSEGWPSMNSEAYLKDAELKSCYQCPRRTSLFRDEHLDGTITYHDNNRAYCKDINSGWTFSGYPSKIVDDMFPITMPYMPSDKTYKVNVQEFLLDPKNGDYDHQRVVSVVTPDGEEILVNNPKYIRREVNGKMESCTLEEWNKDYELFIKNKETVDKIKTMALQREQIEDLTGFSHIKDYLKERPWVHVNKSSKYKKHLKKCMNRIIRRMPIEDTPIGKTNKKPTKGWEY